MLAQKNAEDKEKAMYYLILLQCLELYDQQIAMSNYHNGICDGHFNRTTIAKRILRMSYYCSTMKSDCNEYIKKYIKYQ